jgi:hypothetical protein
MAASVKVPSNSSSACSVREAGDVRPGRRYAPNQPGNMSIIFIELGIGLANGLAIMTKYGKQANPRADD